MSEGTKIEWCDHTFNPWWGCSQVSPGCDHCYAKALAERFRPGRKIWNTDDRLIFGMQHWEEPLRWNQRAWARGRSESVFVGSMCDVFDPDGPKDQREGLWNLIADTPYLDWLLLTKRPDSPLVREVRASDWTNLSVGVTVESQAYIDRIGKLLEIPARSYFVSFEPLLGAIDLRSRAGRAHWFDYIEIGPHTHRKINWAIVGGESGPGARPMDADWVRTLRDDCVRVRMPFFFKQWSRRSGPRREPILDGKTWRQKPPARTWKCPPSPAANCIGAGL